MRPVIDFLTFVKGGPSETKRLANKSWYPVDKVTDMAEVHGAGTSTRRSLVSTLELIHREWTPLF